MSSDRNSPPLPSPPHERRRSSFTGSFVDLFGRSPPNNNHSTTTPYPGPITTAAAQAQRRRLSLTTIGLSGSTNQNSPFSTVRPRGESISSPTSATVDESPFEDEPAPSGSTNSGSNPATPFARRLSFGARALRDVRSGNGNSNGRPSVAKAISPPTVKSRGEGFNFAENMRSRAERTSISGGPHPLPSPPAHPTLHPRAKSVSVMEPPVREMPKQPKVPDAFQERILKGDFYMD